MQRLFFCLVAIVLCLSIWQISLLQVRITPAYTLHTANTTAYTFTLQDIPTDDYGRLIDMPNFKFEILNTPCNQSNPFLLVLIHSSPYNTAKRKTIRETWGQPRENIKVLFMLGKVKNETINSVLREENRVHKDLIQGNFNDAYRNMTYKHVMVLKYAIYHCPHAKYILKTDDDIFVNMPLMETFLTNVLSPYGASNLLLCSVAENPRVLRTYRSKWRVGFVEYPDKYYPTYCSGWALLYSQDVLFRLYLEVQKSKYFWIDDVHVTGTMFKKLNIHHTAVGPWILSCSEMAEIIDGTRTHSSAFLYAQPDLKEEKIRKLWEFVAKYQK